MKTKKEYEKAIEVVRDVVHEWDPYNLLAGGSPLDEFESEIAAIVRQIPRINSAIDATHVLSRVFSSAFEAERFTPEKCSNAGARLHQALRKAGFTE